jgi:hypothetical protein
VREGLYSSHQFCQHHFCVKVKLPLQGKCNLWEWQAVLVWIIKRVLHIMEVLNIQPIKNPVSCSVWNGVLLQKLVVAYLPTYLPTYMRNCLPYMELEGSLPCSQEPATGAWARWIQFTSSHLHVYLSSGLFPSGFPTKILYTSLISLMRSTCTIHPVLIDFITLGRDRSLDIATDYGLDNWGFDSRQGLGTFSSTPCSERLWGPPSLLSNGYRRLFLWG